MALFYTGISDTINTRYKEKFYKIREVFMKNKKGFTLIELLVVISIIAVLMSIMMPALAKVREQAKKTVCMTNLKQWGTIFAMYTNGNDNKFMQEWVSKEKYQGSWLYALKSDYINNPDILLCPGTKRFETANATSTNRGSFGAWTVSSSHIPDPDIAGKIQGSYSINWWVANPEGAMVSGFPTKNHWRRADISQASEVPLFGDAAFWIARAMPGDAPPAQPGQFYESGNSLGMQRFCVDRHDGRIGMLFMDQTVRQVALKRLWTYKWHRYFNTEGPWSSANTTRPAWPDWMKNLPEN